MSAPKVHVAEVIKEMRATNWSKLQADLQAALTREVNCGTTRADGYSSSTRGGPSSGTSDPTLQATMAREQIQRDRLRSCTDDAIRALATAANALRNCRAQLDNIALLVADAPITPKGCDLCTDAGLKQDGQPIPWEHKGNVAGRLPKDMHLCNAHYYFVYNRGYAPSSDQTRHWWTTGTWKVRDTPQTRRADRLLA